jgi:TRAP-type C4-dicarboxylate transport system permease small subunit
MKISLPLILAVIERLTGFLLGLIALLTFVSVGLRYFFATSLPDAYDISRLLLAILIFWGIALTSFHRRHITVELLWNALPPKLRRGLGRFDDALLALTLAALAASSLWKALDTRASGEGTYDLGLPVWPFEGIAALGLAFGALLAVLLLFRSQEKEEAERKEEHG